MQHSNVSSRKSVLDIFSSLNPQQVEAVKEIEKPLLIIAGAGSGKTLTVTSKIAYLIESGVGSESILALSFNQKAAEELKGRVLGLLGSCEDLCISTFHAFCNQVIQDNLLSTKLNSNFRIITDTAQLVYFTKNVDCFGLEYLEFNHEPYTLAEAMRKFISRCKDEFVSVDDLQAYLVKYEKVALDEVAFEDLNCLRDILKIYRAYEDYKFKNSLLDFGDLLCTVYTLLKSKPLVLRGYQEKFKFIIVDEFQDTNYIQLQIVKLLAGEQGHVTVVGDDDQSIYQFRGAQLTNISEFKQMFPNFVEKALEQNYRSTKKIVAVSNALIENSPERSRKQLFTNNPEGDNISVVEAPSDVVQANYILGVVKECLKRYPAQDIAVLCRRRSTAEPIIKAFRKQAIPFNFIGESGFFHQPIIKDVTAFLKVINNPLECNAELFRILNRRVYNIKQVDLCKFNQYADQKKLSLYETLDHLNKIGIETRKILHVKQTLSNIIDTNKRRLILDLVHNILFEQDFYKYEIAFKNNRNMQLLNQFYKFVEEYNNIYPDKELEDFIDYLSVASNFEIEENTINNQAIVISTIHGVKGMQYPVVIIPDVNERKIPTNYKKDKFTIPKELLKGIHSTYNDKDLHIQEERRLLYVALSRAKEQLIITYAKHFGENKTDTKPSKFLQEINYQQNKNITFQQIQDTTTATAIEEEQNEIITTPENHLKTELMHQVISNLTTGQFNEAIENVLLYAKTTNKNVDVQTEIINNIKEPNYQLLEQITEKPLTVPSDHVFSVSQFVGYQKCPRLYQYRHILKIPEKPKYYFDFGSTLHYVVEQLTKMQKEKQPINETIAFDLLDKFWDPKGYKSKLDIQRDYNDAKAVLQIFLDEQSKRKTEILDIERAFETTIGDIRIRGRIDRIDKEEGTSLVVIDYKTSKKEVSLNKLKNDMQLLVYALAMKDMYNNSNKDRDDTESQLKVGNWFLRPNKKVFFTPEKQALDDIQVEIQEMAKKINNAEFKPKKGTWECNYCDYKCLCD
jgi:DNA helicase-2/ATP-dependent DNA helicase PcrA